MAVYVSCGRFVRRIVFPGESEYTKYGLWVTFPDCIDDEIFKGIKVHARGDIGGDLRAEIKAKYMDQFLDAEDVRKKFLKAIHKVFVRNLHNASCLLRWRSSCVAIWGPVLSCRSMFFVHVVESEVVGRVTCANRQVIMLR